MKKWLSMVLVAVLSISLFASCKEEYKTVMTINGEELPAGIYLICQLSAYSEATTLVEDAEEDVLKQEIEGMPALDWIYEKTLEKARQFIYVEQAFAELELEFTEEELAQYAAEMELSWSTYGYIYERNGIGYEAFEAFAYNTYKQTKLYDALMADEEWEVTDEEALAYLSETYVRARMVMFYKISVLDYSALPADTVAMMHAGADGLCAALNDGTVDEVASVERFIMPSYLLIGYTEDMLETSPESYYRVSYISRETTGYSSEFIEELFATESDGVYRVTENENFFAVWTRLENFDTQEEFEELIPSIRYEMMDEAFYSEMKAASTAFEVEVTEAAVAHYSPKNIVW